MTRTITQIVALPTPPVGPRQITPTLAALASDGTLWLGTLQLRTRPMPEPAPIQWTWTQVAALPQP